MKDYFELRFYNRAGRCVHVHAMRSKSPARVVRNARRWFRETMIIGWTWRRAELVIPAGDLADDDTVLLTAEQTAFGRPITFTEA